MKVDASILDFATPGETARRLEALGFDGAFTFEGPHDPFFPLVLASQTTGRIDLYTAIAIAFARNPMLLANIGWDLNALARGRFLLGLGTQIRPHVERRFSMPWSKPAERLREMVLAIRAIWRCWTDGGKLDFRGEFYTHTLMTPMFTPAANAHGAPPVYLAGVGPRMTEVAGEVADGFFVHPLHTRRSVDAVTLPALARGAERAGRKPGEIALSFQIMVASGANDEETERGRETTRAQIAFYGSTPAYRVVLDAHGWGGLQPELNALSKRGQWAEMAKLVGDDVLEEVAVCGPMGEVAARVRERCGAHADRVSLLAHWSPDPEPWADVARDLRAGER